ncbi:MAG: IS3 family transposase [Candidatus Sedimenticola sp. (ex Thyasira tokunagai)]
MEDLNDEFGVSPLCLLLDVSRGGYYAWKKRPGSFQSVYNGMIIDEILKIHREVKETYGSPRMTVELKSRGFSRCENTVAKLMRKIGIRAKMDKRYKPRQWQPGSKIAKSNLLAELPIPKNPHEVWVADFTYTRHHGQFVYFSVIMDLCTRQLVGEEISRTRDADLIVRTFQKAKQRHPEARPKIFHSDRGIEYANHKIGRLLESQAIEQSMSGKGNCYDNAHMESFFHTYKSEMYYTEKFDGIEDFKRKTKKYIRFYNRRRLHSSLGYMSPADYAESKS